MGTLLKTFKQYLGNRLKEDLTAANNKIYVFAAGVTPWTDENNPPSAWESFDDFEQDTARELLFGKKLTDTNFNFLAPRYDWVSNTAYTQYDNTDINLFSKNFYVITDENKVYKCLYNSKGVPSTVKPTLTTNTSFASPGDGYVWKYMYTVPTLTMTNFATTRFIPVTPNTNISASALSGIDVIDVIAGGSEYRTTVNGAIQSQVSANVVQIDNYASLDNGFYVNSAIYITGGPGEGQLATIVNYNSNSSGNFVTANIGLTSISPSFTFYTISPRVVITGDGSGAKAYSVVNTANFSISSVVVIATGNAYSYANVSIVAAASYGSGANVVAYAPPYKGHGYDAVAELGASNIGFYQEFNGNESNTVPTETKYRTVGLLTNPQYYANSTVYGANTFTNVMRVNTTPTTTFTNNEIVIGGVSGARARVVHSNTTVTLLVGDKTFSNNETITGSTSGNFANINIITAGDIKPLSSSILYMNNIVPVQRANSQNEAVKFVIQL